MKKMLSCLCSLSLLFGMAVSSMPAVAADVGIEQSGETVKAGGFTFELDSYNKTAKITGFNQTVYAKQPDSTYNTDHKLIIPASAKSNDGTDYTVTRIDISEYGDAWKDGKEANTFTIVTIPKDVERIDETFTNISSLEYVQFEEGTVLDYNGPFSFDGCSNLKRVGIGSSDRIPEGINYMERNAFRGCESLESITLPSGVWDLWDSSFSYCKSLKKIILPATIKYVGTACFRDCSSLEAVVFDTYSEGENKGKSDLELIDGYFAEYSGGIFENCTSLKDVQLPVSINTYEIGNYCFKNTAIETITIPESVTSIGVEAFADTPLKGIILPSTCSEVKESAFARTKLNEKGLSFNGNAFGLACFCKTVVIDDHAFNSSDKNWDDVVPTAIAGYEGNVSDYVLEFEDYGFTFIPLGDWNPYTVTYKGDVNGDGKVTARDSMIVQRYAIKLAQLTDEQIKVADVDRNGKVNAKDALYILRSSINLAVLPIEN